MSRLRVWGGIFTIAMLLGGGQGLATSMAKSGTYSTANYIKQRPSEKWLTLENAQLDLAQAAHAISGWFGVGNELRAIYVPVFSADDQNRQKIQMVITSQDPKMLQIIRDMREAGNQGRPALIKYMKDNQSQILRTQTISGWARSNQEVDEKTRAKLKNLYGDTLASDFVMVSTNTQPNSLLAGGLLIGGLGLGAWVAAPLLGRSRETTASTSMDTIAS